MLTIKFSATLGVIAGYSHNNLTVESGALSPAQIVAEVWQQEAGKIYASTGVYPGAVVSDSLTVYHRDWGCPVGGELTAIITGEANPEFIQPEKFNTFKASALACLKSCAAILGQTTTQMTFSEVDFFYIKN